MYLSKSIAILGIGVLINGMIVAHIPPADAATTVCTQRVMRKQSKPQKDSCTVHIQKMVNKLVPSAKLKVDGKYGAKTATAVAKWQRQQKRSYSRMYIDGITGPQTWASLCSNSTKYSSVAKKAGCSKSLGCTTKEFSTTTNRRHVCVAYIQNMLNASGKASVAPDGIYGAKTKLAVQKWQGSDAAKFNTTKSGRVGSRTWKSICAYKPAKNKQLYATFARQSGCRS